MRSSTLALSSNNTRVLVMGGIASYDCNPAISNCTSQVKVDPGPVIVSVQDSEQKLTRDPRSINPFDNKTARELSIQRAQEKAGLEKEKLEALAEFDKELKLRTLEEQTKRIRAERYGKDTYLVLNDEVSAGVTCQMVKDALESKYIQVKPQCLGKTSVLKKIASKAAEVVNFIKCTKRPWSKELVNTNLAFQFRGLKNCMLKQLKRIIASVFKWKPPLTEARKQAATRTEAKMQKDKSTPKPPPQRRKWQDVPPLFNV